MLPLLVVLSQTGDPGTDPRLNVSITIEERYLPLSDFASRLAKVTKVPVKVSGDLSARKLTLFVRERSAHETMRMTANALGCRWVRIGEDWNLRKDQEISRAEAQAEATRKIWVRDETLSWMTTFKAAGNSDTPGIEGRAAALIAKSDPTRTADTLISGRPLVATTNGLFGTTRLSLASAFSDTANIAPKEPALFVFRNSNDGVVTLELVDLASPARVQRLIVPKARPKPPTDDTVSKLEEEWAVDQDAKVSEQPLQNLPPEPDPYGTPWISSADVLERLHNRTGLPVAAEAFRVPTCSSSGWLKSTVGETMRSVVTDPIAKINGSVPIVWRSENGWLLARPRSAWRLRPGEIPEASLVPLEKKTPSLEDLSALAGSLTDPQAQAIGIRRPLAAFPTIALYGGYRPLAIYDALTPELRRRVSEGIPYSAMPALAKQRWDSVPLRNWIRADGPTIASVLSGTRPPWAGLRLEPNEGAFAVGLPGDVNVNYTSVLFRLGLSDDAPTYTVPLAVKKT